MYSHFRFVYIYVCINICIYNLIVVGYHIKNTNAFPKNTSLTKELLKFLDEIKK